MYYRAPQHSLFIIKLLI